MIRRPPRSTQSRSSAASDVYKRQLTAYGPLARTVRDAAVFLDATADHLPDGGFSSALDASPEPLRIAVSFKPPPGSLARLTDEHRAAIEQTAVLLRSLGHDVFE